MKTIALVSCLAVSLLASPAVAHSVRLLPDGDGPSTTTTAVTVVDRAPSFALHFGVASVAGAVAAPLGLVLGRVVGDFSILLLPAIIPTAVVFGFFAPTVAALAGWLFGNWNLEGQSRFSFWLGWGAAVLVNIAAHVVGWFAGLTVAQVAGLVLFGVLDGAAMGASSVGVTRLLRPKPGAVTSVIPSRVPGVSDTTLVAVTAVDL